MIDDKKIEEAASVYGASNDYSVIGPDGRISLKPELETAFETGVHWAINEFLKNLWHPMQEEPKLVREEIIIEMFIEGERYTMVQKYMVGVENPATIETIRWISDWDSFLTNSGDDVKMIRWCYFKDLLPKEGGEIHLYSQIRVQPTLPD